jgi:DNA-binding beta-propeller fold protein YncE
MNKNTLGKPAGPETSAGNLSACRCVQTLVLPENTGPLHTILVDAQGNTYYSDEINHCVASTNSQGDFLWRCNSGGSGNEKFRYPRGISLGWVEHGGSSEACIAVADGWNCRIRFLTRGGRYLHSWNGAGDAEFGELADVRFIADRTHTVDDLTTGYWLILDRGNHRVCGLRQDGRLLFQVGRQMAPFATLHWTAPALAPRNHEKNSLLVSDFSPFDFLYYPARIFGCSEDAIFVWQPLEQRLMLLLYGNLLPLAVGPSGIEEWISADGAGYVAWSSRDRRIIFLDNTGEVRSEARIDGIPVPSNLPSNECWVQSSSGLHRMVAERGDPGRADRPFRNAAIVSGTAHRELNRFWENKAHVECAIDCLIASLDPLIALAGRLFAAGRRGPIIAEDLAQMHAELSDLKNECSRARAAFSDAVQPFLLAVLKLKLSAMPLACAQSELQFEAALTVWHNLLDPLESRFRPLIQQVDDLYLLCANINAAPPSEAASLAEVRSLAERMQSEIYEIAAWIESWCRSGPRPGPFLVLPHRGGTAQMPNGSAAEPGLLLRRPPWTTERGDPDLIREVDQIQLGRFGSPGSSQPFSIAVDEDGRLFVSLFGNHKVVAFDSGYRLSVVLGGPGSDPGKFNGPTGLAIDKMGRLYVADSYNRRIQIFNPPYEPSHLSQVLTATSDQLGWLGGICILPDGHALAADAGNHRIVRVSSSDFCEPFCGQEGRGPGEFRNPVSICIGGTGKGERLWVVDKRNHRLQGFDFAGKYLGEVGGFHLKPASLRYPIAAAIMPGGSIVVGQEAPGACLVFFSPAGDELGRVFLDYAPGGMAVHGRQLFVCQFNGDCIHVYEHLQIPD